jgi:hypothetical protein
MDWFEIGKIAFTLVAIIAIILQIILKVKLKQDPNIISFILWIVCALIYAWS